MVANWIAKRHGLEGEFAIKLGEKPLGVNSGRFTLGDSKIIDRKKTRAYKPKPGDFDMRTGIPLVGENGPVDKQDLFNAKQMWLVKDSKNPGKMKPMSARSLRETWGLEYSRGVNADTALSEFKTQPYIVRVIPGQRAKFEQKWAERLGKMKYSNPEVDQLPRFIGSRVSKAERQRWDAALQSEGNEITTSYLNYWHGTIFPGVNRKVLSGLSVFGGLGSGAAYAFSEELGRLPEAYMKREKGRFSESEAAKEREKQDRKTDPSEADKRHQERREKRQHAERMKELENAAQERPKGQVNPDDYTEEELNNTRKAVAGEKGFSGFVTKGPAEQAESYATEDDLTDYLASEVVKMFRDISEACQTVIDAGMPGHESYEELNELLVGLYQIIKAKVIAADELEAEEGEAT